MISLNNERSPKRPKAQASKFIVPSRNPSFVGRASRLEEIHKCLCPPAAEVEPLEQSSLKSVVLCGLGGVGKSQLALEYAYRYKTFFKACFWVTCESQVKTTEGFSAIARILDLSGPDVTQTIGNVKDWLRSTGIKTPSIFPSLKGAQPINLTQFCRRYLVIDIRQRRGTACYEGLLAEFGQRSSASNHPRQQLAFPRIHHTGLPLGHTQHERGGGPSHEFIRTEESKYTVKGCPRHQCRNRGSPVSDPPSHVLHTCGKFKHRKVPPDLPRSPGFKKRRCMGGEHDPLVLSYTGHLLGRCIFQAQSAGRPCLGRYLVS